MSSVHQSLLDQFFGNQRMAIAAAITSVHASIVVFLFIDGLAKWQFLAYVALPTLSTVIIPFFITDPIVGRYDNESMESYLQTLSDATGESSPIASEVQTSPEVLQHLPEEVSDPDSVKIVDEELLNHIDGEKFDPVDADTRGVVAIGFATLLIVISAPIVGLLIGGAIPIICGLLSALAALGIALQQHRDMINVIGYASKSIEP